MEQIFGSFKVKRYSAPEQVLSELMENVLWPPNLRGSYFNIVFFSCLSW